MNDKSTGPKIETRPSFASGWIRRKSIEQVQAEYDSGELKKTLGPWNLLFLGIGCIIGAGIFVRTGNAAALHAGPAVMLAFLVAGLVCAFAGLCYAELASVLPVSGSAYTYSYATLGELAAWMMGALLLLEYGLAASVVAVGWSGYVVSLLHDWHVIIPPEFTGPMGHAVTTFEGGTVTGILNLPAFLVSLLIMSLLVIGVSESATANNVIVVIKGAVIVAFILIGGWVILQMPEKFLPNWDPFIPEPTGERGEYGVGGVMRAASIVFFAYIGFEAVSTAGQEAKNPKKDMPFGILGSLIVCTVLYMGTAAVLTLLVNYKDLNTPAPVADAVNALPANWAWFKVAIKLGAIAGLTSVILVLMYGQTRIFYTMARDGLLPGIFGRVHARFKTPWINTIFVGIIVAVAAGIFDINTLGDLTSVGTLAAFAVVCLTVMYLRNTRPDLDRGFKVPLYPVVPIAGILSCIYLITTVEMRVLSFFAIYVAIAFIIYFVYGAHHSEIGKADKASRKL
ncbi:MAG: amino acid permease [Parvularculaceae bacterium]